MTWAFGQSRIRRGSPPSCPPLCPVRPWMYHGGDPLDLPSIPSSLPTMGDQRRAMSGVSDLEHRSVAALVNTLALAKFPPPIPAQSSCGM